MNHHTQHVFVFDEGDRPLFVKGSNTPSCVIFSDDESLTVRLHADDLDHWIAGLCRLRAGAPARRADLPVDVAT
ncbi:MAG: hypothetical protein ACYS8X_12340 [Planctomycetota bacterium]|jgi:hypothetical protein